MCTFAATKEKKTMKMKTTLLLLMAGVMMTACQESFEDRCDREAKEYTRQQCPKKIAQDVTLDSMTFERGSHTISYCYTVSGAIDNAAAINGEQVRAALLQEVRNSPQLKAYKDASYGLRYVYYSNKEKGTQLFEATFREKDYR